MEDGATKPRIAVDRFAIFLSGLCLLHCLALPFAALLGPSLGHWLLDTETDVHWFLLAVAVPVSLWALLRGFRVHAGLFNLGLGISGLCAMFLGASHLAGEQYEVSFTVIGVIAVMIAHIRNALAHLQHTSTN